MVGVHPNYFSMRWGTLLVVLVGVLGIALGAGITNETLAQQFLDEYDRNASESRNQLVKASWNHATNLTDENQAKSIEESLRHAEFAKKAAEEAKTFAYTSFTDDFMRRQFEKIVDIGTSAMQDQTKFERLNNLEAEMQNIYSTAKPCIAEGQCVGLEPDLTQIMARSRDYNELVAAWKGWRDATGKTMKSHYEEFVGLHNEAIVDNGYPDTGNYWRSWYESDTFTEDISALWTQLKPMYQQIHSYTRRQLQTLYKDHPFPSSGHIPAHLLGNMWAQQWNNLYEDIAPYKNKPTVDITDELEKQRYDAVRMFNVSDEFFRSLGMMPMNELFWQNSMLERPSDGRPVVCHASAWDFYDGEDFRIKQCTVPTHSSMVTVHHEMGHVEYFLQYKHLPVVFRRGANPGFHEGIADVASLSFQTPKHLYEIGLLPELVEDDQVDINFLFNMALQKIAFLPFGYLIDQWRWEVFNGNTKPSQYNDKWWELRCGIQGVSPPVERTADDFDPGAKFHIPANVPYIRYFVSFVIQFQFHKVLCQEAGHTGPLHKCDIYRSTAAGTKFSNMLKLGSSRPWQEAMMNMTGQDKMDASALLEYFQPLKVWLEAQNEGHSVEWSEECPKVDQKSGSAHLTSSVILMAVLSLILCFK